MHTSTASASPQRDGQTRDPIIRRGDGILYAWGEAKRNGEMEGLMMARASSMTEENIRAPGTHSDPVLATLLAAEQLHLACAYTVNSEIEAWAKRKETELWARVAKSYYASHYKHTNADVAAELKISKTTVVMTRTVIRRMIVLAIGVRFRGFDDSDLFL